MSGNNTDIADRIAAKANQIKTWRELELEELAEHYNVPIKCQGEKCTGTVYQLDFYYAMNSPETDNRLARTFCQCNAGQVAREAELKIQEEKKAAQEWLDRLGRANLPTEGRLFDVSLSTYKQTANGNEPYLNYIEGWIARWPDCKTGLVLAGKYGRGKTGLAVAIAHELLQKELVNSSGIYFTTVSGMARFIGKAWAQHDGTEYNYIERMEKAKLLILDDLGAGHKATDEWDEKSPLRYLYDVLDTRYNMERPTIITTNCENEEELAAIVNRRNLNRILGSSKFLICTGRNLRQVVE